MEINSNNIVFNEDTHTYTRNDADYTSVTTLLKNYNLSADYSNIDPVVLAKAAERGKQVHKVLENYIKKNEFVPNVDLGNFMQYIQLRGIDLTTAASEEIVYNDTYKIAGTIDFQYIDGDDIIIADFKTTSSIHWNSVTWQLSIYNYIKTNGDVLSYYLNKLKVIHMYNGKFAIHELPLIEYNEVVKLLEANLNNTPYTYIPDTSMIISDSESVVLEQLMIEINQCEKILEELNAKKAAYSKRLLQNMKDNNQRNLNINNVFMSVKNSYDRHTVDKDLLKAYCDSKGIDINIFLKTTNIPETLSLRYVGGKKHGK